jgi:hypothetical protein
MGNDIPADREYPSFEHEKGVVNWNQVVVQVIWFWKPEFSRSANLRNRSFVQSGHPSSQW